MRHRLFAPLVVVLMLVGLAGPAAAYGPYVATTGAAADGLGRPGGEPSDVNVYVWDTLAGDGYCAGVYVQGKRYDGTNTAWHWVGSTCSSAGATFVYDFANNVELFRVQACRLGPNNCAVSSGWWETNYT